MFWNAQGINSFSKKLQLQHVLNNKYIDVLFLCETFLSETNSFSLSGYRVYRCDRATYGGGVAIAIRSHLNHIQLPTYRTNNIENVSVELKLSNRVVVLTAVYSPKYDNKFKEDIRKITPSDKEFIICGDLNAKHSSWNCTRANTSGNVLFNLQLSSNFFIYHPADPTRYPQSMNGSPTTIDLMLTNSNFLISPLFSHESILPSDHVPVTFSIEAHAEKNYLMRIDYRNANWTQFRNNIESSLPNLNINTFTSAEQVENALTRLISIINNSMTLLPKKKCTPTAIKLSNKTLLCIRMRNMYKRQSQRASNANSRLVLSSIVKTVNKLVDTNIINDNNNHWSKILSRLPKGAKRFFHIAKAFKGKKQNNITSLRHNGELFTADEDKARLIATQFEKAHSLTEDMTHSIERKVSKTIRIIDSTKLLNSNSIEFATEDEIKIHIKNLKNNKAPGFDGIPNRILKMLPNKAITFLINIFNACLKFGIFPSQFKKAKVVAIPKHGKDPRDPSSYRPISLLSSLDKLFEKIILSRMNNFVEHNQLINKEQFGFRQQHSTTHQVKRLTNIIKCNKRKRLSTGILLLDIEKAFDSIWHEGLIYKLKKYDFPLYLLKIIRSFLTDRTFQVVVNNTTSSIRKIPAGVPQGAVLSPTLYSIYVSDFVPRKGTEIALYADDKALIVKGKLSNSIVKRLEKSLHTCTQYYSKWKIKINVNKTQAILFPFNKSRKRIPSIQVHHENHAIVFKDTVKYLGVIVDRKLTFQKHIEYAADKALKCFRCLYPLLNRKSRLNIENKKTIFKAVIRPIMMYGCPVWGNAAKSHIKKLQVLQNRALKTIFRLPRLYRTRYLHTNYCQMTIRELIDFQTQSFLNKCRQSDFDLIRSLSENTI